jgi:hypothetical protein
VREQDRPHRPLDAVREQGDERGRNDDCREDEGNQHERLDQRAPREAES